MAVDYDVVIIGGSIQGRRAAAIAAQEGARVALVEPPGAVELSIRRSLGLQILAQAAQDYQRQTEFKGLSSTAVVPPDWSQLQWWIKAAAEQAHSQLRLEVLATQGVDGMLAIGQFSPKPRLAFTTEHRRLTGRGFLLAPPTEIRIPAIPGLAQTPWLTPDTLFSREPWPTSLLILGRSQGAIALAQGLALLGTSVTLVSRGQRLLPSEDPDISQFVTSLLVAAGVTLRLGAQIESIHGSQEVTIALRTGEKLQAAHLLVATGQQPAVSHLNLERVGVHWDRRRLVTDDRLCTTHPRVFACGPALGGFWTDFSDWQDSQVAIHNALYLPRRSFLQLQRVGYLATSPGYGRVGLTATQARQGYGDVVQVYRVPCSQLPQAQVLSSIIGFSQWVVHRDGRILGGHIIGPEALELVQTAALLIRQDIRLPQLAAQGGIPVSLSASLQQVVDQWQQQRWQPGRWRRDWAENWFNWRRSC